MKEIAIEKKMEVALRYVLAVHYRKKPESHMGVSSTSSKSSRPGSWTSLAPHLTSSMTCVR